MHPHIHVETQTVHTLESPMMHATTKFIMKFPTRLVDRETVYMNLNLVSKRVMVMEVPGKRRRGRPKRRWLDNIKNDLSERELSGEEAQDRIQWRRLIRIIDPQVKVGKDAEEEEEEETHDDEMLQCVVVGVTVVDADRPQREPVTTVTAEYVDRLRRADQR